MLRGTVKGDQNQTYLEVPFEVPAGAVRLNVSFHYLGKEQGTTLDIGVPGSATLSRLWDSALLADWIVSTQRVAILATKYHLQPANLGIYPHVASVSVSECSAPLGC